MDAQPLTRANVDPAFTWNRSSLFVDDAHWETEYTRIMALLPELVALRGSLSAGAVALLHALTLHDGVAAAIDRIVLYASLQRDEDTTQAEAQARADRAEDLRTRFRAATAFFNPDIIALPEAILSQFLHDMPELETYRFFLLNLRRQQEHVQSPAIETVIAEARRLTEMPLALFGAIKDADFRPPTIEGDDGNPITVTHGRYWALLRGTSRSVRRAAYTAYSAQFRARQHALAAALANAVHRDVFLARVRNYPSALHAALDVDAIPVTVYTELIAAVGEHIPLLHRALALRRRILGIDSLRFDDLWVPLASTMFAIDYDQARQTLVDALAPLGPEYGAILKRGLYAGRWVDVYETAHKRSGAYSAGAFGAPPFILLNWQQQFNDLNTLAHEAGHAMHTYFACAAQPYVYSDYGIFVAEVASICNEILLCEHLAATAAEPTTQLFVISHQMQRIIELLFWQALFAEFDKLLHEHVEAGQALTAAWLSATMAELQQKYYGSAVELDADASIVWALFPHFYLNFYVYKFATGIVAALALSQQIRSEGRVAVERYLTFLRSGSSTTAIDALRAAGVDMTTSTPTEQAMQVFAGLLDRFEAALDAIEVRA